MAETDSSTAKPVKVPGPDHRITIEPNPNRIIISVAGRVVADTRTALTLREANYPPVQYIPRADVKMELLDRTDHTTYCPYKGDCSYFSIPSGGERSKNAVWTYEAPYPAVSMIRECLADLFPVLVDLPLQRYQGSGQRHRQQALGGGDGTVGAGELIGAGKDLQAFFD